MTILMKGKQYSKRRDKVVFPAYMEPKIDDIRCLVTVDLLVGTVSYHSYADNDLHNMSMFNAQFKALAADTGHHQFDIGIEVNGNFNDSYRWVRSSNGLPQRKVDKKTGKVAPALLPCMVVLHLFDLPQLSQMSYALRCLQSAEVARKGCYHHLPLEALPRRTVCSHEEIEEEYVRLRGLKYEGAMVKQPLGLYALGGRNDDWLKMKPDDDADGVIIGFIEAKDKYGDSFNPPRVGSVMVQMPDGSRADPHGLDHDLAALMWMRPEDYLGEWCAFSFMERDRKGGYRHCVSPRLREAK
jgi:hypothetical protein